MAGPLILPLVDEGLGNSAYLVGLGDGRALAVDPSRDLRALHESAAKHGLTVAYTAETHLHADFLTGSLQLAADQGAQVLGSAAGHRSSTTAGPRKVTRSTSAGSRCAPSRLPATHPSTCPTCSSTVEPSSPCSQVARSSSAQPPAPTSPARRTPRPSRRAQ
jgi:glyoxylase-like metal-dependent hydrolase (beta-lactamase superfamily II)